MTDLLQKKGESVSSKKNLYFKKCTDAAKAMEDIIIEIVSAASGKIGVIQNDNNIWESEYDTTSGEEIIRYDYVEITEVEVK